MAFVKDCPSLPLFPGIDDTRVFSHAALNLLHQEIQTDLTNVDMSRDVFTQLDIDALTESAQPQEDREPRKCPRISCSKSRIWNFFCYFLPILSAVQNYKHDLRHKLLGDLLSGLSVACLHFPQGLAYGLLASLTPKEGLYTSFFPVLFYSIFGSCQHMSFATDSVVAIMTSEVVNTQVTNVFLMKMNTSTNTSAAVYDAELLDYKISVAASCTLVCGMILVAMAICRFGFLTSYQSKSFIGGFTTAAAFHIFVSQIPKGLGIKIPAAEGIGKLIMKFKYIFMDIAKTNVGSIVVVIICVLFLLFIKDFINVKFKTRLRAPVPAELILIIIATIISANSGLEEKFGIEVVGSIETGISAPKLPKLNEFVDILPKCVEIAVIIFFLSNAMAKVCAEQHEYEIDDNRELTAYGFTNIVCSFFPCFPASVSPPRNMILSSMGAKTTMNGVFTTCVMLLVLYVLSGLFAQLPVPTLAAMIFVSVKPLLLQVRLLPKLYKVNIYDFIIWIITFLTGVLMDLPYGLMIGIGVSVAIVVVQSQILKAEVMHRTAEQIFMNVNGNTAKIVNSKIVLFKWYSSLYFATSEKFRRTLYASTKNPLEVKFKSVTEIVVTFSNSFPSEPSDSSNSRTDNNSIISRTRVHSITSSSSDGEIKVIIIDCSAVTYIDIQGINTLSVVFEEYRRVGITILLAECTPFMWKCLKNSDFFKVVSQERVFYQVQDAFFAAKSFVH